MAVIADWSSSLVFDLVTCYHDVAFEVVDQQVASVDRLSAATPADADKLRLEAHEALAFTLGWMALRYQTRASRISGSSGLRFSPGM